MKTLVALSLILAWSSAVAQTQAPPSRAEQEANVEFQFGQLEEIAMCHHAIKAARHDGLALGQNPYYRYILNSPQKGHDENVYPIPARCKNLETQWVLDYAQLSQKFKDMQDSTIQTQIQMTIPEISADAQFMTVVINKMELEGSKATFLDNRDKDTP
ncbi:hypothetical protein [Granulicella mallensis]|uniref:Uncharacterized protein n=1 Tax=Granulicella mallensis TaxID=940614 RepID=A0A7W7ZRI9_9BACT|nr:hypothetical protein [Granulicella mallensis]MBB5064815.1 hypothetical protein [Granulicella mallensis]